MAVCISDVSLGRLETDQNTFLASSFLYEKKGLKETVSSGLDVEAVTSIAVESLSCRSVLGYQSEDISAVRNALKLASKFLRDLHHGWGPAADLHLSSHAAETGMLLALAGAPRDQIVAGILYDAFRLRTEEQNEKLMPTVVRKFGVGVKDLLNTCLAWPSSGLEPEASTASLLCAVTIADITAGFRNYEAQALYNLEQSCRKLGVPSLLMEQLSLEISRTISRDGGHGDPYTAVEVIDIRNALRMAALLFNRNQRRWGPYESLPMTTHAAEVGLILAMGGCEKSVIVAGVLHDLFEGYIAESCSMLKSFVEEWFGSRTAELVMGFTEPYKDDPQRTWLERKLPVLERVLLGSAELATVACAAKTSTIAAGNKMLYMGQPISAWSAGTLEENVTMFRRYAEIFAEKGVPPVLLRQFGQELTRMESYLPIPELEALASSN